MIAYSVRFPSAYFIFQAGAFSLEERLAHGAMPCED